MSKATVKATMPSTVLNSVLKTPAMNLNMTLNVFVADASSPQGRWIHRFLYWRPEEQTYPSYTIKVSENK